MLEVPLDKLKIELISNSNVRGALPFMHLNPLAVKSTSVLLNVIGLFTPYEK